MHKYIILAKEEKRNKKGKEKKGNERNKTI